MNKKSPEFNKFLIDLYCNKKISCKEISDLILKEKNIKLSHNSVRRRLIANGIKLRKSNEDKIIINDNIIIELYNSGKSTIEISEILKKEHGLDLSFGGVKYRLQRNNIKLKTPKDYSKLNLIDKETISYHYIENFKSCEEISKLYNCNPETIRTFLINNNIGRRKNIEYAISNFIDTEDLINQYNNKIPTKILANKYKCDVNTIYSILRKNDIARNNNVTYIEHKVKDLLNKNNIEYITKTRKIITPLELDFYIPDYNLAIEVNGIYWHSFISSKKSKKYHYDKYINCKNNNVTLLQFWEDDINKKFEIISSMILSRCGKIENKLDARKCIIKELSFAEIKLFCNENHIQGKPANSNKGLGLFYHDKLVSMISFTVKDVITITRFCSLLNHTIRGSFSKLLSKLISYNKPIKTYSSNDISDGKLYSNNGFECIAETIDMYYTSQDFNNLLNREQFMKHKLKDKLEMFDENLTEQQNMILNGYDVVYKSGVKTWSLDVI